MASGGVLAAIAGIVLSGCIVGQTGDARYVADDAATLEGVLLSTQSGSGQYWFEYGRTTSYGESTPQFTVDVGQGTPRPVSVRVEGLKQGTTYHYRLCGVDNDADPQGVCGADRMFTTGKRRESVIGGATITPGPASGASASVAAAADPDGAGYLDGNAAVGGYFPGPPPYQYPVSWGGEGQVSCLRVDGNVAVVRFSFQDPISA